jgi:uncharacterized caspase-like protein
MLDTRWHYAVVVGIDQYPRIDAGRRDLRCPLEDARRMAQWLSSRQGGNLAGRVTTLTPTIPPGRTPDPVFDDINSAILKCAENFVTNRKQELLDEATRKAAWRISRFYFYISGHGMDGDGDDAALITANATYESMNHISTRNVLNLLRKNNVFGELVVLADCCRDLAGVDVQALPWNLSKFKGYNDDDGLPKIFIAYASRTRKRAYEPPPGSPIKNSIFTQALLEGLEGGVPGEQVDSKSLERFLYNYVPVLARKLKTPDQNPEIKADPGIIFVQSSKSYLVTLTAGPGSAFAAFPAVDAVETLGSKVMIRATLLRDKQGVFKGALPTGYYVALPVGADPYGGSPVFAFKVLGADLNVPIP